MIGLLEVTGEWTASFYEVIDPASDGEPVGFFGAGANGSSPYWQSIAREYLERWVHHSQLRRALGLSSMNDVRFVSAAMEVVGTGLDLASISPAHGTNWALGQVSLGTVDEAADILIRRYTADELSLRLLGAPDSVATIIRVAAR